VVQARYAEVLLRERSRDETHAATAAAILEDLATREVMPDAEAWASLARSRSLAKNGEGASFAAAQCKKLARGRKHACKQAG
jgi:predicted Zn-dependent protease